MHKNYKEYALPNKEKRHLGIFPDYERGKISDMRGVDEFSKAHLPPEKQKAPLEERLMHMISDRQVDIKKLTEEVERLENLLEEEKKAHLLDNRRFERQLKRLRNED
jgi:hypothetical protein